LIEEIVKLKLEILTKKMNSNEQILISDNITLDEEPRRTDAFPYKNSLLQGIINTAKCIDISVDVPRISINNNKKRLDISADKSSLYLCILSIEIN
jgi:hypothetical protein